MRVSRPAMAGSLESNDILIQLFPDEVLSIDLESPVKQQFGAAIESVIREMLEELEAGPVRVVAKDRGALDFAIRARVRTAVERGSVS